MATTQFVKSDLEFTRLLSMGSRWDTTNLSSLSVLVYGEKYDFGSKMLLVNRARLSGLVSVRTMCGDFRADCKNGSRFQLLLDI